MGLYLYAKGCEFKFELGYIRFSVLMIAVAKAAYDTKMYEIYKAYRSYPFRYPTQEELYYWNEHCNDDLDLLILHSDTGGVLKSGQCKKVYNAIKDLSLTPQDDWIIEKFIELRAIIKWCADNKKTLVFG